MYGRVPTSPKKLDDYRPVAGDAAVDELRRLAAPLRGARVLHLSVTAFGTVVADMLNALVPMLNELGLSSHWEVIRGGEDFVAVGKAVYQALGGRFLSWTAEMRDTWQRYNLLNAELLDESFDYVVVHDPQPVGLLSSVESLGRRSLARHWIWHCHLDLSDAQPEVWDMLRPAVEHYDQVVFDRVEDVRRELQRPRTSVIWPSIDPLGTRNMMWVANELVDSVLQRFGVRPELPLLTQVSPFDRWHDPLGVIDVYERIKPAVPGLQLVLVACMDPEDANARSYFELAAAQVRNDPDVHVLSTLDDIGNLEINVLQRAAAVVLQRGLRKGFGLGVSEAMWKERPVVAGRVGGMPLQVVDGVTGYLVDTPAQCVEKTAYLLRDRAVADRMGRQAKEQVRQHFLITRQLRDYLSLFKTLTGGT